LHSALHMACRVTTSILSCVWVPDNWAPVLMIISILNLVPGGSDSGPD